MQIVIDIPDEQIEKSLVESKYIHENEGEKGSVYIAMLYTNAQLEFVDVERKTDFYSCEYKILPKGHGRLIDADAIPEQIELKGFLKQDNAHLVTIDRVKEALNNAPTVVKANTESEVSQNGDSN